MVLVIYTIYTYIFTYTSEAIIPLHTNKNTYKGYTNTYILT